MTPTAHITEVRRVPYQHRYMAQCTCGWQQHTYCTTTDGAQRWANNHKRKAQ